MNDSTTKKDLKQQYKNSVSNAGIYLITHKQNGTFLLGSAQNARGVLNRHQFELKFKQHRNKALQQDWDRDGENAFSLSVLETVKPDEKNIVSALEQLLEKWQFELRKNNGQPY